MEFKNGRALVTGGSKGIGRSIAQALIAEGMQVAIMSRNREELEQAAEEIKALAVPGDVSREEDAKSAVARTVESFGGLDLLINNAGFGRFARLDDVASKDFREVLETNVLGVVHMTQEALPHFRKQGRGHIVNISSTAGLKGFQGGTIYVASKFALKGMTECWREELRRENIRVMLCNPSEVQTSFGGKDPGPLNPKKLRGTEIADAVVGALRLDDRGFIPEFSVFATNPF
jgi:3-oxoacyl-[acyl-carrier protein] reductase